MSDLTLSGMNTYLNEDKPVEKGMIGQMKDVNYKNPTHFQKWRNDDEKSEIEDLMVPVVIESDDNTKSKKQKEKETDYILSDEEGKDDEEGDDDNDDDDDDDDEEGGAERFRVEERKKRSSEVRERAFVPNPKRRKWQYSQFQRPKGTPETTNKTVPPSKPNQPTTTITTQSTTSSTTTPPPDIMKDMYNLQKMVLSTIQQNKENAEKKKALEAVIERMKEESRKKDEMIEQLKQKVEAQEEQLNMALKDLTADIDEVRDAHNVYLDSMEEDEFGNLRYKKVMKLKSKIGDASTSHKEG